MSIDHFDITKTTDIIRKIIEEILNTNQYRLEHIDKWTRQIVDSCQRSLFEIQNSFKTIITAMIIPKTNENIHMSNACLWDFAADGSTIIKWENDSMYCVVSAFALSSSSITTQLTIT
ncbi:unnamed protein product [Adineta steineri]|uniref:Dynein light chain Tctex-type 1 n=1 Tax=Adineta steineri TaxID=433720 RepID=A0A814MEH4_9BILA|nr:unnamed protein product [Adineta steineri]